MEDHTHIPIKGGHATFRGKDFKPSKEIMDALEKLAEIVQSKDFQITITPEQKEIDDIIKNMDDISKPLSEGY